MDPFDETSLRGLKLKNRFIRSATWEGMADPCGAPTRELIELMGELASGGVGLIITGHIFVSEEGRAGPRQLGLYSDELIPPLRKMVEEVHLRDGKIVAQIAHAGIQAAYNITHMEPLGPSEPPEGITRGRAMTKEEIMGVRDSFREAARRAVEAGFDGIQIHAAHGYLLSQFLSPYFNKRGDEYGGPVENRARLLLEILTDVRGVVGPEMPILVKMNCEDFLDAGLTLEESLAVAKLVEQQGADAIEVSGGMRLSGPRLMPSRLGIKEPSHEAYFKGAAREFKKAISIPVILVGGIRSYEVVEGLLAEGVADYISMSRPFIREPWLINRWKGGDRRKAFCVSDNRCFGPAQRGEGIYCVTEKEGKDV